jgi:hypothetical protein
MCDLFAMLQQRYQDFSSEVLILSFCVYVFTLYLFLLCLFFLFWPHFGFDALFGLFVLLVALRKAFKLLPVKREAALFVHVRPYFFYFYLSLTGYFYFRRVVRNDSLVRRLRRQRSRPCAVGH